MDEEEEEVEEKEKEEVEEEEEGKEVEEEEEEEVVEEVTGHSAHGGHTHLLMIWSAPRSPDSRFGWCCRNHGYAHSPHTQRHLTEEGEEDVT